MTKKSISLGNLGNLLCSNSVLSKDELNYLLDAFYETSVSFNEELSNSINSKLLEYILASDIKGNVTIIPKSNSVVQNTQASIIQDISNIKDIADNKLLELNNSLYTSERFSEIEIASNLRNFFGDPIDISLINSTTIINFKDKIGLSLQAVNTLLGYTTSSLSKLQLSRILLDVYNQEDDIESVRRLTSFIEGDTSHSMTKFNLEQLLNDEKVIETIKKDLSNSIENLSYREITEYLFHNFKAGYRCGSFNRELIQEYFKTIFPNAVSLFLNPKLFAKQAIKRHFGEVLDPNKIKTYHIMKLKEQGVGYGKAGIILIGVHRNVQTPKYFIDVLAAAYADCPVSMNILRTHCKLKRFTLNIDKS